MGIENGGVFCADRFGDALLQFEDLHPRLYERRLETPYLTCNLSRLDAVAGNVIAVVPHDMNNAAADPGGYPGAVKPNFLLRFIAITTHARRG